MKWGPDYKHSILLPTLHDLATPVSALEGTLELIDKSKDRKETSMLINIAKESTQQINDILQLSMAHATGSVQHDEFLLSVPLRRSTRILHSKMLHSGIELSVEINCDIKLYGSQSNLERVFLNIINNSIEELKELPARNNYLKKIDVITRPGTTYDCEILISDNGRGVPPELVSKIFDQGYSTKSLPSNRGLGLKLVKQVVEQELKGELRIETCTTSGVTFKILLNSHS